MAGHCSKPFFSLWRHGATSAEVYRNCGRGTRPKMGRELISLLKKIYQKSFSLQPSPPEAGSLRLVEAAYLRNSGSM